MKRIVSTVTMALVAVAMTVAMAMPAFAQGRPQGHVERGPEHANLREGRGRGLR